MSTPFVWHELLTSDPAAAASFYGSLFGWDVTGDRVAVGGQPAAGLRKSNLHPHWAPFVRVDDPEASARAAAALGGRVAGRPSSPAGIVLLDPKGVPTVVTAEDGTDLFGWHLREATDEDATAAWLAAIAGFSRPPRGGLWRADIQVGSLVGGPADRWLGLVVVTDRLDVRSRAISLGGSVERPDVDASGHGRYDILVDPQGAAFCAFEAPA